MKSQLSVNDDDDEVNADVMFTVIDYITPVLVLIFMLLKTELKPGSVEEHIHFMLR